MTRTTRIAMLCTGAALLFAAGAAKAADTMPDPEKAKVPSSWGYAMKNGKRVNTGERTTNADGSWTEVRTKGGCTTTKEKTKEGELKVTRKCD